MIDLNRDDLISEQKESPLQWLDAYLLRLEGIEIIEPIGQGSFGKVYLALKNGERVAIKQNKQDHFIQSIQELIQAR